MQLPKLSRLAPAPVPTIPPPVTPGPSVPLGLWQDVGSPVLHQLLFHEPPCCCLFVHLFSLAFPPTRIRVLQTTGRRRQRAGKGRQVSWPLDVSVSPVTQLAVFSQILCLFPRAAVAKYHIKQDKLTFHSSGGQKSQIKVFRGTREALEKNLALSVSATGGP